MIFRTKLIKDKSRYLFLVLKGMHSSNKDLDKFDKARYQNVIDGMQNTDALLEVKALANHIHAQSDSTY